MNLACPFNIRVFKSPTQKARLLVEFQRRNGCVMAFSKIYQRLLCSFSSEGIAVGPPPRPLLSLPSFDLVLDKKTAALMIQTLCQPDVSLECIRETLRVLSCLSKQSQNLEILFEVNSNLPELLISFLKSKDVETLRCAATFLANILAVHSTHVVVREHISLLFDVFSSNDLISPGFSTNTRNLLHLEVKRHISRSLATLSSKGTSISKDPLFSSYVKTLKETTLSPDTKLQAFANQTLLNFAR